MPVVVNHLWARFDFFELDEIMRQHREKEFCAALNNMSEGVMTDEDVLLMQTRQISHSVRPHSESVRLFLTNAECEKFNSEYHATLGTEGAESIAFDVVSGQCARHIL